VFVFYVSDVCDILFLCFWFRGVATILADTAVQGAVDQEPKSSALKYFSAHLWPVK